MSEEELEEYSEVINGMGYTPEQVTEAAEEFGVPLSTALDGLKEVLVQTGGARPLSYQLMSVHIEDTNLIKWFLFMNRLEGG